MSTFYASIQGNRGEATREGSAKSGIVGHIRSWTLVVRVIGHIENDQEVFYVYKTSGSRATKPAELIATIEQ